MSRNPQNWNEYQYGTSPHRSSMSSTDGRSVHFDQHERSRSATSGLLDVPPEERLESGDQDGLRRRRSSIALRLNSIAQAGGVNSIENFARSWTRAAGFHEVTTSRRPSFILSTDSGAGEGDEDEEAPTHYDRRDLEQGRLPRTSLLRAHLEASGSLEDAVDDDDSFTPGSDPTTPRPLDPTASACKQLGSQATSPQRSAKEIQPPYSIASHLASTLSGSYGTSYGTIQSTLSRSSMIHAGQIWRQQARSGAPGLEAEREPLIVKEVEQDGKIVLAVEGQSTLPQTVFNSTNVLIGVGLLSLPMGIKYSGWICGMIFLLSSALVTAYTARLLAKCMDADASLITFADLAFVSYGQRARIVTSLLFTLELVAACVALVVLFADTLDLLIPGIGVNEWKILCGLLLIPLNFAPLKLLSLSSVVGIFSCFCIVSIVFIDGFIKPRAPGSLREPAKTYLFPENWLTLPLSFGLLMSPWGGHSVFPNIYRDMRHPAKFPRAVKITFTFTYALDCLTAVAGILMFGDSVRDEITANIIGTKGYPKALSIALCVFIAIIPLTKLPLNARPIVSTIDVLMRLDPQLALDDGRSPHTVTILKAIVRIIVIFILVIIAIVFPAFDSIMAFMGSSLCFTICVILPVLFYLKIFGKEISAKERILDYVLVAVCSVLAVAGTIWAFLPKSMIGAR